MGHAHNHFHGHHDRSSLIRAATFFSVANVTLIVILKIIGWLYTDSVSMLASLTDSLLDVAASVINLVAVRYALQPPDNEHRFGHEKAEDLAVFTQSAFFSASGVFLVFACIQRSFSPQTIEHSSLGIAIMVISIIATSILVAFQRYVIKKTGSNVVAADCLHYKTDVLSNVVVIISILVSRKWDATLVDPIFAFAIAIYIIINAWSMLKKAFNNLMDHELDEAEKQKIIEIIKQHQEVKGVHDLKTRYAGNKPFIQFHLVLDKRMDLSTAHDIAQEIEQNLLHAFPGAEILSHQDPEDSNEHVQYPLP